MPPEHPSYHAGPEVAMRNSSLPSAATTVGSRENEAPELQHGRTDMAHLQDEVDRLVRRHHADLSRCFEDFFRRKDDAAAMAVARSTLGASAPPGVVTWCEDLETIPGSQDVGKPGHTNNETPNRGGFMSVMPSVSANRSSKATTEVGPKPTDSSSTSQAPQRSKKRKKTAKKFNEVLHGNGENDPETVLQRIVHSRFYEWFSGSLILLNAVFIGWQTQQMAADAETDAMAGRRSSAIMPVGFVVAEGIFTVLFAIELGLRWISEGLIQFFREAEDLVWNILDTLIVSLSIMDMIIYLSQSNDDSRATGSVQILRVVRVVRIVRVIRVIRIMKFFRELRMMVYSILGSMKSLLWVMVVFAMMFYIFGITFTAAVTTELDNIAIWTGESFPGVKEYFGTVDRSVLSLFMAMSGGNDWVEFYSAVKFLPHIYRFLFLGYIMFAVFGVLNIVTGVFVDSALTVSMKDHDVIVSEELEAKKAYLRSMRDLFESMDTSMSGCVSLEEFEQQLDDERVIAYFNALKLDVSDAQTLFRLLDHDRSNEVNIDEFITGCYKLQGASRSLDMKIMQHEVKFLQSSVDHMTDDLARVLRVVKSLPKEA